MTRTRTLNLDASCIIGNVNRSGEDMTDEFKSCNIMQGIKRRWQS